MAGYFYKSLLLSFMVSCVSVGPVSLSDDNLMQLQKREVREINTTPLKEYNGGTIADFESGNINQWSGSSKIILSKKDGNLVVNAVGVGQEYDRFNYTFLPEVDFSETNILKVRVKAKGDRLPTLRIDLKDASGAVTNSRDAKARLILCDEYVTYYFRYEGRFRQSWPVNKSVNAQQIAGMEFFINPGGTNFTGQLLIDEITPISEELMWTEIGNYQPPCDVSVNTDFDENAKFCWTNSSLYTIGHEDQALKVTSRGAGSDYQSFGVGFSMSDLSQRPIIQIKAKLKGESAAQLRMDLVDFSGNATNGDIREVTIPNDDTYRTYTFDYQDKMFQGWPVTTKVDSRYINELMFFMNPGGPAMNGVLFIDDIQLIHHPLEASWDRASFYPLDQRKDYTLFNSTTSDNTWWVSTNQKLNLSEAGIIIPKEVRQKEFGTGTDVFMADKEDFLTLKTNTDISTLRVKLMDARGAMSDYGLMTDHNDTLIIDLKSLLASNEQLNPKMITGLIFTFEETLSENLVISSISLNNTQK